MVGYKIDRQLAEFGEHVRGWRMVLGLTAQQVSERAGITRDTLRKIEAGASARPLADTPRTERVSHMMIANPFRGGGMSKLFSTHPPMDERVRRLEQMAGY